MIPMTSVEILQDLLKFGKDLLPLLSEKKLDTVIAGLAEAKAIVDRHKDIQVEIVKADEKIAKALELEANNAEKSKALDEAIASVNAAIAAVAKREADADVVDKANKAESSRLVKALAQCEAKDAKLSEAIAKAEADAKEIETAKEAITAKLANLSEVA